MNVSAASKSGEIRRRQSGMAIFMTVAMIATETFTQMACRTVFVKIVKSNQWVMIL